MEHNPASIDPVVPPENASPATESPPGPRAATYLLAVLASLTSLIVLLGGAMVLAATVTASYPDVREWVFAGGRTEVLTAASICLVWLLMALLPLLAAFPPLLASVTILRTRRLPQRRSIVFATWASLLAAAALLLIPLLPLTYDHTAYMIPATALLFLAPVIGFDIVLLRAVAAARQTASPKSSTPPPPIA